jgi:hypothetical protein
MDRMREPINQRTDKHRRGTCIIQPKKSTSLGIPRRECRWSNLRHDKDKRKGTFNRIIMTKEQGEKLLKTYREEVAKINKEMSDIHKNTISHINEQTGIGESLWNTFKYRMDELICKRREYTKLSQEILMLIRLGEHEKSQEHA